MKKMDTTAFARYANVSRATVAHYTKKGLLVPVDTKVNYSGGNESCYYDESSYERLKEILYWKDTGLSLDDINNLLPASEHEKRKAARERRDVLTKQNEQNELIIYKLTTFLEEECDAITSDNSKFKNKMEIQEEPKMIKDETTKYEVEAMLLKTANETPITGERHGKIINTVITQIVDKVGNTNSPCQENPFATLSHKGVATHLVSRCLMSVNSPHTSEDEIENIVMANLCNHKCLYTFENKGYNSFDKSFRNAINDISSKNKGSITTADFLLIAENIKNYCEEYYKNCPNEVSKVFFETEFYKNTESYVEDIINEIFPFLDYCFGSPYVEYYSKIFDDYKNEPTFIYDKEFDSLCSKLYHSDMTQHERNIIEAIRDVYIYKLKILSAMDFCEKLRYSKNLEYIPTEEAAFDWLEQVINSGRRLAKIDEIEKAVNRPNPCEECIKMMEDDLENNTADHYDEVCTYLSDNDQWDHWHSEVIDKAIEVYCNDLITVSEDELAKDLDITDECGNGDSQKLKRILEAKKHCYSIDW